MSTATATFISYWGAAATQRARYVHPADNDVSDDSKFELSLLPKPWVGDLRSAECVILMLNPGLSPQDITWEQNAEYLAAVKRNLAGDAAATPYPFFYLDPAFAHHPGAGYWAHSRRLGGGTRDPQKLHALIGALAERDHSSIEAAQRHIARKVAVVQLLAYHSKALKSRALLGSLDSCEKARSFVKGLVCEGSKLVVAIRAVQAWGFGEAMATSTLVVYRPAQGATASLAPTSPGGKAILTRISRVENEA